MFGANLRRKNEQGEFIITGEGLIPDETIEIQATIIQRSFLLFSTFKDISPRKQKNMT